jgi:hypothetical protein
MSDVLMVPIRVLLPVTYEGESVGLPLCGVDVVRHNSSLSEDVYNDISEVWCCVLDQAKKSLLALLLYVRDDT